MKDIDCYKRLGDIEGNTELADNNNVLLLSPEATRELAIALSDYLDTISPYEPEKQESVAHVYNDLTEKTNDEIRNNGFTKGRFLTLTQRTLYHCQQALETYTPENEPAYNDLRDAITQATPQEV